MDYLGAQWSYFPSSIQASWCQNVLQWATCRSNARTRGGCNNVCCYERHRVCNQENIH
uniref:Top1 n=1 Tax=Arundo donax TaxID=35708 RepID=A0A0A9EZR8_ARUDO